jgi:biopolymer transport protein ExbD
MKLKKPESHANHVNVVPMVDVIMCLIIFYMLAAKIGVDTGEDEKIKIPFASWSKEIKDMGQALLINVSENETTKEPIVTAKVDLQSAREPLVVAGAGSGRRLVDVLTRLRYGADLKPGGSGPNEDLPELKLVIRGDKDMSFGVLQQVLMAAAEARVKSFNFQTSTVQDPS